MVSRSNNIVPDNFNQSLPCLLLREFRWPPIAHKNRNLYSFMNGIIRFLTLTSCIFLEWSRMNCTGLHKTTSLRARACVKGRDRHCLATHFPNLISEELLSRTCLAKSANSVHLRSTVFILISNRMMVCSITWLQCLLMLFPST